MIIQKSNPVNKMKIMKPRQLKNYVISKALWQTHQTELMQVRTAVFIDEQLVPAQDEIDNHDSLSYHLLVHNEGGKAVGTGRLTDQGQIGRMAVLKEFRGENIGHLLMVNLMNKALSDRQQIIELSAQTHAIDFYRRYGFITVGRVYDEVGIPHQKMVYKHI